ncbi:MAG: polysaccharide pyruvyl transferase family protein [Lachnospiraceae bacterium]|nr:polysaccharide pyruvyl transferase family protein [Lachnospiraceae bacterium]
MKYGIITYTSAQNWGGILQSYALYHYLQKQGVDCDLLNYRNFDERLFKPRKQIKDIIFSLLMYKQNKMRIERYKNFRTKCLKLDSSVVSTEDELQALNRQYDAFITGSDQLWNCETEICYDFYLKFAEESKVLLSYGPSFGQENIPQQFEKEVAELLKRYDMKSVREKSGGNIVKRLIGEEIQVVCDPTFLLDRQEWESVSNPDIQESNYIFIYTTQVSQKVIELVKAYKKKNPSVRVITPYAIPGVKADVRKDIGPAEFLSYIRNADYVIGTSFHAVVFSLIFGRNFCVVPHSSTGARVNDLLSRMGLEKNAIGGSVPDEFPTLMECEYKAELENYINESKEYITRMIHYKNSYII